MVVYHIIKPRFNHSTHCTAALHTAARRRRIHYTHRSAFIINHRRWRCIPHTINPHDHREWAERSENNIYAETPVSNKIAGVPLSIIPCRRHTQLSLKFNIYAVGMLILIAFRLNTFINL